MPTITQTVDVDFDLDDIDDYDLVEEVRSRGFTVYEPGDDDRDLVHAVQDRGYTVYGKLHHKDDDITKLYTTYMTTSPEFFEKELKKYFREKLNISLY